MRPIVGVALLLVALNAVAQEGYVCVADKATGFSFNESTKTWEHARFSVTDVKYLLSRSGGKWSWKPFGGKQSYSCGEFSDYGYLNCQGAVKRIYFNNKNLRYMIYYTAGYVTAGVADSPEGADTPNIEIGKCTSM